MRRHPLGVDSRSESLVVAALWHGRASMSDDFDLTVVKVCWSIG
jgi:hypothetical protein